MPKPYSQDLRERAVARVLSGESVRVVAAALDVSVASVVKWSQRHRATGSVAPGQMGGWKRFVLEPHKAFIAARFAEEAELTLRGLQKELAARGIEASYGAIWRFVHSQGLSFKKNRSGKRTGQARRSKTAHPLEAVSSQN